MRQTSRVPALQNRVFWGGALSGRDINAVQLTVSGLEGSIFLRLSWHHLAKILLSDSLARSVLGAYAPFEELT